jgi:hypothetical protein
MTNPARLALLISLATAACSSDPTLGPDPSLSSSSLLKNPVKGTKNKDAALRLDGVDDHADVASALAFDVDILTVEAWVRLDQDVGPTQARVVNRQASQSGIEGWGLQIFGAGYPGTSSTGNAVAFHSNNCTAAKNLETGYNLRKRRWYHLAAVNDGTTLRVYVDGRLVGSTSSLGPPCKPINAPIVVGKTGPSPAFFFPGRIDDVRIWRVARSRTEIAGNMNSELSGREPGLVVYWPFDEGTGTTAFDKTGQGHDATLRNGVSWTKHKMNGRSNDDDDDDDDD